MELEPDKESLSKYQLCKQLLYTVLLWQSLLTCNQFIFITIKMKNWKPFLCPGNLTDFTIRRNIFKPCSIWWERNAIQNFVFVFILIWRRNRGPCKTSQDKWFFHLKEIQDYGKMLVYKHATFNYWQMLFVGPLHILLYWKSSSEPATIFSWKTLSSLVFKRTKVQWRLRMYFATVPL